MDKGYNGGEHDSHDDDKHTVGRLHIIIIKRVSLFASISLVFTSRRRKTTRVCSINMYTVLQYSRKPNGYTPRCCWVSVTITTSICSNGRGRPRMTYYFNMHNIVYSYYSCIRHSWVNIIIVPPPHHLPLVDG